VVLLAIATQPRLRAYALIRRWIALTLGLSGIRVVARGLEKLDPSKPYVFMANHVNLLDPFFYGMVMPVPYYGVEKRENFKIPFYGWLMSTWGNIPIDRRNLDQAKIDLENARVAIHRDAAWMIVMPEGTRTRDGLVLPFKKGVFHLALATDVPVVPVSMNGAYEIQARGSFWARGGEVELVFHDPIDPGHHTLEDLMIAVRKDILSGFTGPISEEDRLLVASKELDTPVR
jgi:1-acyl-sn-glycerol-3-phosphate acyltransferase